MCQSKYNSEIKHKTAASLSKKIRFQPISPNIPETTFFVWSWSFNDSLWQGESNFCFRSLQRILFVTLRTYIVDSQSGSFRHLWGRFHSERVRKRKTWVYKIEMDFLRRHKQHTLLYQIKSNFSTYIMLSYNRHINYLCIFKTCLRNVMKM